MLDPSLPISKQDFDSTNPRLLSEHRASPELTSAFSERAVSVVCTQDEVLFKRREPANAVYLVKAGEVGLMMLISGTRTVGFRAEAGSLVGLPAAFGNEPYSMTAVAWKGAELAVMSRERFCDMIAANSTLSLDVLRILADETRSARIAITEIGLK